MYKNICTLIVEANILNVIWSVKDPCGLALCPTTTTIENALENIIPEEDILEGEDVACQVHDIKPISSDAKYMIVALLDHTAASMSPSGPGSRTSIISKPKLCTPEQLMLIMRCSV